MTETFVNNAAHILIALVFPPVLLGVIGKTKALFAGRVGPPSGLSPRRRIRSNWSAGPPRGL